MIEFEGIEEMPKYIVYSNQWDEVLYIANSYSELEKYVTDGVSLEEVQDGDLICFRATGLAKFNFDIQINLTGIADI